MKTPRMPSNVDFDFTVLVPGMLRRLVEFGGDADQPRVPTYIVKGRKRSNGTAQWWPERGTTPDQNYMRIVIHGRVFDPRFGDRYCLYVLAHELAHIACYREFGLAHDHHGPKFMAHFKRLCPPTLWHYETNYKPRNAMLAGISIDVATNVRRAARNP